MASTKISEIENELSEVTGDDLVEVSEKTGEDSYETKKWAPGTMANEDKNALPNLDFAEEYDNDTADADITIDWSNGQNQKITLGADVTLSFNNMGVGHKQLRIFQDGTGGRTPTLPSGKWPGGSAGDFSTSAGAEDILSIFYTGSEYRYQLAKGWA